jgi:hypothetical protein
MLHSIRLLALLLIGFTSFSQETLIKIKTDTSSKMKTLFKPSRLSSFGFSFQSQVLFGKGGPQQGVGLQVHLNNKLSLGIASFNSMRDRDGGRQMDLRQRFTAFTMEATPMANKVVHLSFPLAIGRIQEEAPLMVFPAYLFSSSMMMPQPGPGYRNDFRGPHALGIQPGINLEVNLFKYIKVFGGANYRFAFGEEKTPGMSRGAGTLGVKVGVFDYRKKR